MLLQYESKMNDFFINIGITFKRKGCKEIFFSYSDKLKQ